MNILPKRFLAGIILFIMATIASCDKFEDEVSVSEGLDGLDLPSTLHNYEAVPHLSHFMFSQAVKILIFHNYKTL